MHEYSVSLRISGAKLDPTEVTTRIGLTPPQVRTAGQFRSDKSVWDESMWEYEIRPKGTTDWASLGEGLESVLAVFQPRTEVVRHYQSGFHVFLWCGHFSSSFAGGPTLSPSLLKQLADFGVELVLDTHFVDDSGDP